MAKHLRVLVFALMTAVIGACSGGKNPISGPDPIQPGPPVVSQPPSAATASWIVIEDVRTPRGQPIPYLASGQSYVSVTVRYAYDANIPGRVIIRTYLSEDCTSVIPRSGGGMGTSGISGTVISSPDALYKSSGISRTKCIISRLETVDDRWNTLSVVAEAKKEYELNFFDAGLQ